MDVLAQLDEQLHTIRRGMARRLYAQQAMSGEAFQHRVEAAITAGDRTPITAEALQERLAELG